MIAIGTAPDDWELYRDLARENRGLHPVHGRDPSLLADDGWEQRWPARGILGRERGRRSGRARANAASTGSTCRRKPEAAEAALARQKAAFAAQLALAKTLGCPVVIHSRGAFRECVDMIDASGVDWRRVVFHCFSEGEAEIRELASRGRTRLVHGNPHLQERRRGARRGQGAGPRRA